ncbi:MAG: lysophospholipid acyltransferase family protein [Flavobacteriales bacterium]
MKVLKGFLSLAWKAYCAIVFIFLAILFYPFFFILVKIPKHKKKGFVIFRWWSHLFRRLCFYRLHIINANESLNGPYIIVANHTSYLDIFLMYSILPHHEFKFLGKSEILSYPIVRTYFKAMNVPVHRQNKSKAAIAYLGATKAIEEGYSLAIFPEATFPTENLPKMLPFKQGAFKIAKTLQIPLLPLTFENNFILFSDLVDWLGPAKPGTSIVHIHKRIEVEEIAKLTVEELNAKCHDIISLPLKRKYPSVY